MKKEIEMVVVKPASNEGSDKTLVEVKSSQSASNETKEVSASLVSKKHNKPLNILSCFPTSSIQSVCVLPL